MAQLFMLLHVDVDNVSVVDQWGTPEILGTIHARKKAMLMAYLFVLLHVDVDNVSRVDPLLEPLQQLLLNALLQLGCHLCLGFPLPIPFLSPAGVP